MQVVVASHGGGRERGVTGSPITASSHWLAPPPGHRPTGITTAVSLSPAPLDPPALLPPPLLLTGPDLPAAALLPSVAAALLPSAAALQVRLHHVHRQLTRRRARASGWSRVPCPGTLMDIVDATSHLWRSGGSPQDVGTMG